ncbi:lysylphosphatidylglycerol synthase domain-containing protein [Gelidibacter salicanalis]|uniref:Flippase-like domain-containing protein n=1 Tax=Gelidibacter salicanalis TaxID=291193 RepID=A0A934KT01_9FLAO|nr:lysylphosphatidylglycerol synthase domain-containing protein [Gelidibacter salicanalis]MBJ7881495.1 flippase-like domain-containing protein [Gelidibacter salicanalis]
MLTAISYKSKQFLPTLIKLGLVVAAFYVIHSKLFQNSDLHFNELLKNVMDFSSISANTLLILILLSIFNWVFEILKWKQLVSSVSIISFNAAKEQSLGALTASLLTPNRIGDYGAKALYYHPELRKKIIFLNFIGNSIQMGVTTLVGSIGLTYFTLLYQPKLNGIGILSGIVVIGILFLIWTMNANWLQKQKQPLYKHLAFIKCISKQTLSKIILFSLIRYLIFSFQFYYLLIVFGVELNYLEAMAAISSMYLLSSIIPSIFIFDVVIKGGVAVYLFGLMGISEAIVLSIVTLMWILNFVLPSFIGSYHVLQFKLPKTEA